MCSCIGSQSAGGSTHMSVEPAPERDAVYAHSLRLDENRTYDPFYERVGPPCVWVIYAGNELSATDYIQLATARSHFNAALIYGCENDRPDESILLAFFNGNGKQQGRLLRGIIFLMRWRLIHCYFRSG